MRGLLILSLAALLGGCTLILSASGGLNASDGDGDIDAGLDAGSDADSDLSVIIDASRDADDDADVTIEADADEEVDADAETLTDADSDADADDGGIDGDVDEPDCPELPTNTATELFAAESDTIVVDGSLDDWNVDEAYELRAPGDFFCIPPETDCADTPEDCTALIALRWNADALYLAVAVTDDVHENGESGVALYRGDSIQVGFDMELDRTVDHYNDDDREFGWALTDSGVASFRWQPEQTEPFSGAGFVAPLPTMLVYEIELPRSELGHPSPFRADEQFGFAFMVNDNDGDDRTGFLEWSEGLGWGPKDPSSFGTLTLVAVPEECRVPH